MNRFATTVEFYERARPQYLVEFFATVATALGFMRSHRLIDLVIGPGLLAFGFAPFVGMVTGVDPEPAMLKQAKEAAAHASRRLHLIEGQPRHCLPRRDRSISSRSDGRWIGWIRSGRMSFWVV